MSKPKLTYGQRIAQLEAQADAQAQIIDATLQLVQQLATELLPKEVLDGPVEETNETSGS